MDGEFDLLTFQSHTKLLHGFRRFGI